MFQCLKCLKIIVAGVCCWLVTLNSISARQRLWVQNHYKYSYAKRCVMRTVMLPATREQLCTRYFQLRIYKCIVLQVFANLLLDYAAKLFTKYNVNMKSRKCFKSNSPKPGHVHHDFTNPIHALSESRMLGKYWRTLSSKTAKLALLDRHLLTAVNKETFSFLCTL